jgi:hypothetical protein
MNQYPRAFVQLQRRTRLRFLACDAGQPGPLLPPRGTNGEGADIELFAAHPPKTLILRATGNMLHSAYQSLIAQFRGGLAMCPRLRSAGGPDRWDLCHGDRDAAGGSSGPNRALGAPVGRGVPRDPGSARLREAGARQDRSLRSECGVASEPAPGGEPRAPRHRECPAEHHDHIFPFLERSIRAATPNIEGDLR